MLCSPHNPVGRVWSAADLRTLSPGPELGSQGSGFARLNMGTSPELLGEAVRRMSGALHDPR